MISKKLLTVLGLMASSVAFSQEYSGRSHAANEAAEKAKKSAEDAKKEKDLKEAELVDLKLIEALSRGPVDSWTLPWD